MRSTVGRPTITASCIETREKDIFAPWRPARRDPTEVESRLVLKEALRIGLSVVMHNHTYVFESTIRRKDEGGAIGLDLTGMLTQVFMM